MMQDSALQVIEMERIVELDIKDMVAVLDRVGPKSEGRR